MVLLEGFLLGIASGSACLAYCAPVLVPYLLGEGDTVRRSAVAVGGFLAGRFAGYLLFALLAWGTHRTIIESLPHRTAMVGVITMALALLLVLYGITGRAGRCQAASAHAVPDRVLLSHPLLLPMLLGLLTGVSLCPPFLMAFGGAIQLPALWQSLLFFAAFFVGTSVYLAPLPLVGRAGRHEVVKTVGRLAAGVVGLFYLYSGVVSVAAGLREV
jgi:hypothetical protein